MLREVGEDIRQNLTAAPLRTHDAREQDPAGIGQQGSLTHEKFSAEILPGIPTMKGGRNS
jgi:hypothetical protein